MEIEHEPWFEGRTFHLDRPQDLRRTIAIDSRVEDADRRSERLGELGGNAGFARQPDAEGCRGPDEKDARAPVRYPLCVAVSGIVDGDREAHPGARHHRREM